ncbi:biopolymer transporter ExbD [Allohahella marinimesophila]|uniref:Biopolymer transport protein ExbD n=1 Tax=Allohahella marinimesophila TaxID=1054972 RepID=A0ABP7PEX3_9GAMM
MKQSAKARRHNRHYRRHKKVGGLNLVSLMDIFTILVFFLMVNSSDVKVLETTAKVDLPLSISEGELGETLTLSVTPQQIAVGNRMIAEVSAIQGSSELIIEPLRKELRYQAERRPRTDEEIAAGEGMPITVLADKSLNYSLLKRVMATCVEAGYSRISLATQRELMQTVEPDDGATTGTGTGVSG